MSSTECLLVTLLEVKVPSGNFLGSLGSPYTGTPKRCCKESSYTLRSKGAKLHLLGLFGMSLYWHPQKVERTLLRTLIWGSLKET